MKKGIAILVLGFILGISSLSAQKGKYDFGADSAECVKQLFLFQEFTKQKNYVDAYGPWEKATSICPQSRKSLYTKGSKMLKNLIKGEKDATKKTELIDKLMWMYDTRIEAFGQEGYVLGLKGIDFYKYNPDKAEEAMVIMKKSIDTQGNKSKASVLSSYFSAIYNSFKEEKTPVSVLLDEYIVVSDIINFNLEKLTEGETEPDEKAAKAIEGFKTTKENVDTYFIAVAECEDIVKLYEEKIGASPDDFELHKKALSILNRKDCVDFPLFLQVTEYVHDKEPTAESASALGKIYLKKGETAKAFQYFEEAVELCGNCPDKLSNLTNAGLVAVALGKSSKANSYASKMLQEDPNSGMAYIIKGDVIRSRSKECDDGKMGSISVFWLAADYYARAKSVDQSEKVVDQANKKAASCRSRYPTQKDLFFHDMKGGDSYTVPCIGESTIVKVSN